MKSNIIRASFGIGVVILILSSFLWYNLPWNRAKARSVAENYLQEKYEEEMVYLNTRLSLVEPSCYQVRFYPKSDPEVQFEVVVLPNDFSLPKNPDNYIQQYFCVQMEKQYEAIVRSIWNETATINFFSESRYQKTPLNTEMALSSISQNIDYLILVHLPFRLTEENTNEEAHNIFSIIQLFRNDAINTPKLTFIFRDENDSDHVDEVRLRFYVFYSVEDISDETQVEEIIKAELARQNKSSD